LSFNSKLSHFDKNLNLNLNLNHKWLSPGENRYGFDLWRSPCTFRGFLKEYFPIHEPLQHLLNFGRFEMNKRDLGYQREDRILVAEEEILHEPATNKD
jgi:hypothetical protein